MTIFENFSLNLLPPSYNLRGHHLKQQLSHSRLNVRKNFFSQRVVLEWNSLPKLVIEASSIISSRTVLINTGRTWAIKDEASSKLINLQVQIKIQMSRL